MNPLVKSVLLRFVKGFCAGALSTMAVVSPFVGQNWHDLWAWLTALAFALVSGGITGGLLALEKAYHWTE